MMGKGTSMLRNTWASLELPFTDGLTHIFSTVKVTQNICDLPSNYQAVLEWARIS
jgi:hypothetical protein